MNRNTPGNNQSNDRFEEIKRTRSSGNIIQNAFKGMSDNHSLKTRSSSSSLKKLSSGPSSDRSSSGNRIDDQRMRSESLSSSSGGSSNTNSYSNIRAATSHPQRSAIPTSKTSGNTVAPPPTTTTATATSKQQQQEDKHRWHPPGFLESVSKHGIHGHIHGSGDHGYAPTYNPNTSNTSTKSVSSSPKVAEKNKKHDSASGTSAQTKPHPYTAQALPQHMRKKSPFFSLKRLTSTSSLPSFSDHSKDDDHHGNASTSASTRPPLFKNASSALFSSPSNTNSSISVVNPSHDHHSHKKVSSKMKSSSPTNNDTSFSTHSGSQTNNSLSNDENTNTHGSNVRSILKDNSQNPVKSSSIGTPTTSFPMTPSTSNASTKNYVDDTGSTNTNMQIQQHRERLGSYSHNEHLAHPERHDRRGSTQKTVVSELPVPPPMKKTQSLLGFFTRSSNHHNQYSSNSSSRPVTITVRASSGYNSSQNSSHTSGHTSAYTSGPNSSNNSTHNSGHPSRQSSHTGGGQNSHASNGSSSSSLKSSKHSASNHLLSKNPSQETQDDSNTIKTVTESEPKKTVRSEEKKYEDSRDTGTPASKIEESLPNVESAANNEHSTNDDVVTLSGSIEMTHPSSSIVPDQDLTKEEQTGSGSTHHAERDDEKGNSSTEQITTDETKANTLNPPHPKKDSTAGIFSLDTNLDDLNDITSLISQQSLNIPPESSETSGTRKPIATNKDARAAQGRDLTIPANKDSILRNPAKLPPTSVQTSWKAPESWDIYFVDDSTQNSSNSIDSSGTPKNKTIKQPNKLYSDKLKKTGNKHHDKKRKSQDESAKLSTSGQQASHQKYDRHPHKIHHDEKLENLSAKSKSLGNIKMKRHAVESDENKRDSDEFSSTSSLNSSMILPSSSEDENDDTRLQERDVSFQHSSLEKQSGNELLPAASASDQQKGSKMNEETLPGQPDLDKIELGYPSSISEFQEKTTPRKTKQSHYHSSDFSSPGENDDEFHDEIILYKRKQSMQSQENSSDLKAFREKAKKYASNKASGTSSTQQSTTSDSTTSAITDKSTSSSLPKQGVFSQRALENPSTFIASEDEHLKYERYYNDLSDLNKKQTYVIRIYRQTEGAFMDGTFTCLSLYLDTTVQEIIPLLKKKFSLPQTSVFQLSLRIGKLSKILHHNSKPISIQIRLLLLSGYRKHHDALNLLGMDDLSFVFQFTFHPLISSQLSVEQESNLMRRGDFVRADLRDMNLTRPPIVFYQQAGDIESMDVSNNANMILPLDFVESAISLSSIRMVNIRASQFPPNLCEVNKLVTLELSRNLIKKIPQQIAKLENLSILNLQCNKLERLPQGFANLRHLQILDLSSNKFTAFPDIICECTNLLQIDLSNNRIQSIPQNINNLTKVAKINISNNRLRKVGDLSQMRNLRTLTIRYNFISVFRTNCESLQNIYVTGNRISVFDDTVPSLRTLEMHKNPLTSLFPTNDQLSNLTTLSLNKANLSSLPSVIWQKFVQLKKLELNENSLSQLPAAISNLTKLMYLSVNKNKLESIPETLPSLKNLKSLDLHSNNIRYLCSNFEKLQLTTLNLSSNTLDSLQEDILFDITDSEDHFPISKTLMFLSIADNALDNTAWSWLNLFKKLRHLNISYNKFSKLVYKDSFFLTELTELYISGNYISALPGDIIFNNLRNLKVLMANGNRLQTLPAELSALRQLSVLDVGDNDLKYNISNFEHEWSWVENKELKYLNFSGNKRFEIFGTPVDGVDYSDLSALTQLKVLGLMDVTLKTFKVPDETFNLRSRTTESSVNGMNYGVADTLGTKDFVTSRDFTLEKFRGRSNEALICLFEGKNEISNTNNRIPKVVRDIFADVFARALEKADDSDRAIKNALRLSFLQLNKELNAMTIAAESKDVRDSMEDPPITSIDLSSGSTATVVYIKGEQVFVANVGDTMAVLGKTFGEHAVLTENHSPNMMEEYTRIRIAGGYVNNNRVDGVSTVSRAVGFFHLLPHIHASPAIKNFTIARTDEIIIIATHNFWEYIDYETASDIAKMCQDRPMVAAAKLKDFAIAYGCTDSLTVICFSLKTEHANKNQRRITLNKKELRNIRSHNYEDNKLRALPVEIQPPTGNVAIVFTDIKNSTYLWELCPDAMRSAIKTHNSVMRRQLRVFGGYEVKTEGDAFMVAFSTPTRALLCCLTVQLKLLEVEWPAEIVSTKDGCLITDENNQILFYGLSVRMGIHWGRPVTEMDIVTKRMDYLGPMVNKASRVSSVADGGQVALSADFVQEFYNILALQKHANQNSDLSKELYNDAEDFAYVGSETKVLKEIGYNFYPLGEVKLKGLETMESITLAYPKALHKRYKMFEEESPGLFTSKESLFYLRQISLKLEYILSCVNGGAYCISKGGRSTTLSEFTKETQDSIFRNQSDDDLMDFLDHLITRIETVTCALSLRQRMEGALICENKDGNVQKQSVFELLDSLLEMLDQKKQ
ncbi:hypothetical protein ACO0QE_000379 [Hanseniaspora vineae]